MIAVEYYGHVFELRFRLFDPCHSRFDNVAYIHDVGVGSTVDLETNSLFPVQAVIFLFGRVIVGHASNIGDSKTFVADREVFHILKNLQFPRNACH